MNTRHFILATAGHVDHGKSALIKALTATDPDRLPEEKKRGITIDLGFAHIGLEDRDAEYDLGVIDVPGHEDFVKNMVAGVGSIDLALLVVAADDGWMPQTEEHLHILTYLGVKRAVVALTKIDLIEEDEDFYVELIREELRGSPIADAPIIKTAAPTGRGIEELRAALLEVLREAPDPANVKKPRLPVDRVFSLEGIGTVVTGTLTGGPLAVDQNVVAQPGARPYRVRGLQHHSRPVPTAFPGTRTAVNLAPAGGSSDKALHRGDVIARADYGRSTRVWFVRLDKTARGEGHFSGTGKPIRHAVMLRVCHGSGQTPAKVFFLEGRACHAGESAIARLRFEEPVYGLDGDRFIVRDWSDRFTLGGGVILDSIGDRRVFRRPPQRDFLEQRAAQPSSLRVEIASRVSRDGCATLEALGACSRHAQSEVEAAAMELVREGTLAKQGKFLLDAASWEALLDEAARRIDAYHAAFPERPGMPDADLKALFGGAGDERVDALIKSLAGRGYLRTREFLHAESHAAGLSDELQATAETMLATLGENPREPPSRKDVCKPDPSGRVLRFLLGDGRVVELGDALLLLTEAWETLRDEVCAYIRANGPATASDLRKHLGVSRRIAIPLLERMDALGVTRRDGDYRELKTD